jgi:hypothetical protein
MSNSDTINALRRRISQMPATLDDVLACHPLADDGDFAHLVEIFRTQCPTYPPAEIVRLAADLHPIAFPRSTELQ